MFVERGLIIKTREEWKDRRKGKHTAGKERWGHLTSPVTHSCHISVKPDVTTSSRRKLKRVG